MSKRKKNEELSYLEKLNNKKRNDDFVIVGVAFMLLFLVEISAWSVAIYRGGESRYYLVPIVSTISLFMYQFLKISNHHAKFYANRKDAEDYKAYKEITGQNPSQAAQKTIISNNLNFYKEQKTTSNTEGINGVVKKFGKKAAL